MNFVGSSQLPVPVSGGGFERIVPNVIDRRISVAPSQQQIRNVLFYVRMVALAVFVPSRMVNGELKVYQYQCGQYDAGWNTAQF